MGFMAFIIFTAIVLGIAFVGTWALNYFLPGHPAIVDKIIWGLALVIVVVKLAGAIGLMGADVAIPTVK